MTKVKIPLMQKSKKTSLGKVINNTPTLKTYDMNIFNKTVEHTFYNKKKHIDVVTPWLGEEKNYIITGRVNVEVYIKETGETKYTTRKFQMPMRAAANLDDRQLFNVVGHKLQEFYDKPKFGNSYQRVLAFSMNMLNIPDNFNFSKRAKIYSSSNLELKLFNALSEENIKVKENCVIDYVYNELQKYRKKNNKNKLIKMFEEQGYNKEDGVTLNIFKNVMDNNYKNIEYIIIGPDFNIIQRKKAKCTKNKRLMMTFYINNKHLYPITDEKVQDTINRKAGKGINDLYNYFKEMVIDNNFKSVEYMKDVDNDLENDNIYVLNKDLDIDDYCIELIKKHNSGIEYIDLDHKTGAIKEFKHPTKNIMICEYADYHNRKSVVDKINKKFNNLFMNYKNQSFACIAKKLLNMLDDIPKSYYRTDTLNYLSKYEPKPIIDILKTCDKDDIVQVDYYKQYSSIFYVDFQKEGFQIPIYDVFNDVNEYNNENITLGEYFIKQKKYKNVIMFGCFVHSYVVKELLRKKVITKKDITHCINTKRGFTPKCFQEFVKLTSEICDEKQFKQLNNWLNGTLKDTVIRNSKNYFTDDINSLSYIITNAEKNNLKYSWTHNEKTNYNFVKTYSEEYKNMNTSSFYRSTLSCSILQTIKLIKKCSKYGKIRKVLTDAVYFSPNDKSYIDMCPPKIEGKIIQNLGRYFFDIVDKDLEKNRQNDKIFTFNPIEKKNNYISGGGGFGKSYMIIDRLKKEQNKNIIFLSTTNKAIIELKLKIFKILGAVPDNWKLQTFAYFETFYNVTSIKSFVNKLNTFDKIVVDEMTMTQHKFFRFLEICDTNKIYLGDYEQLGAITHSKNEKFDLHKYLCKYYIHEEKLYVEGKSRYDKKTYKIINNFKTTSSTKLLKKKLNKINDKEVYDFYIVSTNAKKIAYNKKCCDKKHKHQKMEYYFDSHKQAYYIGPEMPIICVKNDPDLKKEYSVINNWIGKLTEIIKDDNGKIIKFELSGPVIYNNVIEEGSFIVGTDKFKNYFAPVYASTIHKYQGAKINSKYAIIETKRKYSYFDDGIWFDGERKLCTKNMLYTALTRTTDYKNIHIYKDKRMDDIFYPEKITTSIIDMNEEHKHYYCYKKSIVVSNVKVNEKGEDCETASEQIIYEISAKRLDDEEEEFDNITTKKIMNEMLKTLLDKKNEKYYKKTCMQPIEAKFKPKIEQSKKNKTKIYIAKNSVRVTYYDESNIRVEKLIKQTKKRSLNEAYNNAHNIVTQMLSMTGKNINDFQIVDKNKLMLTFD
jgi:hypothetical protein